MTKVAIVRLALFSRRFRAPIARRHAGGELERGPPGDGAPRVTGGEGREHGVEERHARPAGIARRCLARSRRLVKLCPVGSATSPTHDPAPRRETITHAS